MSNVNGKNERVPTRTLTTDTQQPTPDSQEPTTTTTTHDNRHLTTRNQLQPHRHTSEKQPYHRQLHLKIKTNTLHLTTRNQLQPSTTPENYDNRHLATCDKNLPPTATPENSKPTNDYRKTTDNPSRKKRPSSPAIT